MPQVLTEVVAGAPVTFFISASTAFTPTGELRRELFGVDSRILLDDLFSQPPVDGCIHDEARHVSYINFEPPTSLAEASTAADLVLEAVVTSREYGFRGSEPGQLLELAPETSDHQGRESGPLYVFLPVGRFEAGPYTICKTDERYIGEPIIGSRVVLFIGKYMRHGQFADVLGPNGMIGVDARGALDLPKALRGSDAPRSIEELRNFVRNVRADQRERR